MKETTGRKIAKFAIGTFVGMAAGTVTTMLIKQNVDLVKLNQKIATAVGSFGVAWLVEDLVTEKVDGLFDQVCETVDAIKQLNSKPEEDITIEEKLEGGE